jgi:ABC-type phosphate/phosphonate transport system substrate-binding protein
VNAGHSTNLTRIRSDTNYNLIPSDQTETQHYKSVVIINNKANINQMSDLKGKRSCHGGLNSTHGWDIPIGLLLATMTMSPDCRGEMYSVSKFFEQSCAPGKWNSSMKHSEAKNFSKM